MKICYLLFIRLASGNATPSLWNITILLVFSPYTVVELVFRRRGGVATCKQDGLEE